MEQDLLEAIKRYVVEHDLLEPVAVADIFVTGLGKIERASNGCMRFYFFAEQNGERILAAKLVIPDECVDAMIEDLTRMVAELRQADRYNPRIAKRAD